MKHKLYRAGFLPYRIVNCRVEFLFMLPADERYGGDRYQIAKGKVEEGETALQAALREASEELGLIEDNIVGLTLVGEYLGRTTFFAAQVIDDEAFNEPHFETKDTTWMSVEEFEKVGRELHIPIVLDAHKYINYQLTLK